jgi:hypothetical protein
MRLALDDVLRRIPLNPPWTVGEFASWISEDTGMQVVLEPHRLFAQPEGGAWSPDRRPWGSPSGSSGSATAGLGACGLLLQTVDGRLIIRYDPRRSVRHQRQQIFHEFGHILCDHEGDTSLEIADSIFTEGIDPAVIKAVLHRDCFDTPTEQQAELLGTKLAVYSRGEVSDQNGRLHRGAAFVESLRQ